MGTTSRYGRDSDRLLVVTDRATKMTHLIPSNANETAEDTAELLLNFVFKYYGLPRSIHSDRAPVSMSETPSLNLEHLKMRSQVSVRFSFSLVCIKQRSEKKRFDEIWPSLAAQERSPASTNDPQTARNWFENDTIMVPSWPTCSETATKWLQAKCRFQHTQTIQNITKITDKWLSNAPTSGAKLIVGKHSQKCHAKTRHSVLVRNTGIQKMPAQPTTRLSMRNIFFFSEDEFGSFPSLLTSLTSNGPQTVRKCHKSAWNWPQNHSDTKRVWSLRGKGRPLKCSSLWL